MKTLLTTTMCLAVLGLIVAAGASTASAASKTASRYECLTDDGYGRKLPCSYGFKVSKRADGSFDCFTDDGYGRKLPCSYGIKRR